MKQAATKAVSFRIPGELAEKIGEISTKYSVSDSHVFRWALDALVDLERVKGNLSLPLEFPQNPERSSHFIVEENRPLVDRMRNLPIYGSEIKEFPPDYKEAYFHLVDEKNYNPKAAVWKIAEISNLSSEDYQHLWMNSERWETSRSSSPNITTLPKKKAHIMAAAGPGIAAEVIDWDGEGDTVAVKICGDSMSPLFQDGDVIDMNHKRASRSPYMAKGMIYLVQLNGEWMVKRYDTRRPRKDEKDAEYLTGSKMVGILKSENPEFDDIDITGPFEWAAWFTE